MDIDTIRLFMRIAEGNTLSSVAEDANLSQSSLSKSIIRLENELDVQLLDRSRRNAALTPAGKALYRRLKEISPLFTEAMLEVKALSSSRRISLCVLPVPHMYELNEHIAAFTRTHPDIDIELNGHTDNDLTFRRMEQGAVDLIITHLPLVDTQVSNYLPLHDDALVAAMSSTHPLAERESVTFEELSKSKCVIRHSIQKLLRYLHCSAAALSRMETRDNADFDRLRRISAIRFGNFTSIFYLCDLLPLRLNGIKLVPIKGYEDLPLVVAYSKNRPLTTQQKTLIRYLQEVLASPEYSLIKPEVPEQNAFS